MAEFLDWLKVGFGAMIGLLIMFAFSHTPIGDSAKLKAALTSSAACVSQKNALSTDLGQCQANARALAASLKAEQANASSAMTSLQSQCNASMRGSFNAGVIAGRELEKRTLANGVSSSTSTSVSASDATDDSMSDFATLWSGATASH